MYFLHAINSDRQTRLLNVLGQIAMIMGDKKNWRNTEKLTLRIHKLFNEVINENTIKLIKVTEKSE